MIRFNILDKDTFESVGYLELAKNTNISFKKRNKQFFFAQMEMGRSTQFDVPATDHNRILLGFGNDPIEEGVFLRRRNPAQMQMSGNAIEGWLSIMEYSNGAFKCIFYYDSSVELEAINGVELKDMYCSFKPVTWNTGTPIDANDASLDSTPIALVRYRNNWSESGLVGLQWFYAPSVNLRLYLEDLLTNAGVRHKLDISYKHRFIAPSMKGADRVAGVVAKTGMTAGTIDVALSPYLGFDTSAKLYWRGAFGIAVRNDCWAIYCKQAVNLTFPIDFPNNYELISVNHNKIEFTTDRYFDAFGWHGEPLAGRTVQLSQGTSFFIVADEGYPYDNSHIRGWKADRSPFSFTFTVSRSGDIALGEDWFVQDNAPNMTIVDMLRSAALIEGKELYYDPDIGVVIGNQDFGSLQRFEIEKAVDIDSVVRYVKDWGNVNSVVVRFDSEDYVTAPIVDEYSINNEIVDGKAEHVIKFNEGMAFRDGSGDIYLEDVSINGTAVKISAKKTSVAKCGSGINMKREQISSYEMNTAIVNDSTSVTLRVIMDADDFLRLGMDAMMTWHGVMYCWTSATWSNGIATLTLQVVG